MGFDKFLKAEIQKELEEQDRFVSHLKEAAAAKQQEQNRARAAALEFRDLVEDTHRRLLPVIHGFIANANSVVKKGRFKLTAEKPLAKDCFYTYRLLKIEKDPIKIWGLFSPSIDFEVVRIHFGYNFYDKLLVVRMEGAGTNIHNYDTSDVIGAGFTERFAQDLIGHSGHYMRSG